MIRQFKNLADGMGIKSAVKLMLCTIESHIKLFKSHKLVKIVSKKLGGDFCIRRNTTDIILAKTIAGKAGEYDFIYSKRFLPYFKNPNIIIDAGANVGFFSRLCVGINNQVKLIAIEPESDNFRILKENLTETNAICLNNGVWNREAKLKVYRRETGEWGFIVKETEDENYDIDAISIPKLIKKYALDEIDILKIDIEGSEYEVFDENAEIWIKRVKLLLIELHDRIKPWCAYRVFCTMKNCGFSYQIYGDVYVFYKK